MNQLDYIIQAMKNLGGKASYEQLYCEFEKIYPGNFSKEWKAGIRRYI